MRIAIITLPLHTNYGGVLQAYALQKTLEGMGHSVSILQPPKILPEPKGFSFLRKTVTRPFRKYILGQREVEVFRERRINREFPVVGREFVRFFDKYLNIRRISSLRQISKSDYDAFVVGSDQILRPAYNPYLLHSLLDFTFRNIKNVSLSRDDAKGWKVKRVVYGASFGSDVWEFTPKQTYIAKLLLYYFEGTSFREKSGVVLAHKNLNQWSLPVLDPTMLLPKEDYLALVGEYRKTVVNQAGRHGGTDFIFEYVLDRTDGSKDTVAAFERALSADNAGDGRHIVRFLSEDPRGTGEIGKRIQPPVGEWIGAISEASFVITDSFHACVFSILFHRPFAVIANRSRGVSRIEWLLEQFGLEGRLVRDLSDNAVAELVGQDIDWAEVDSLLSDMKGDSLEFLTYSLNLDRGKNKFGTILPKTQIYRDVVLNVYKK